MYGLMTTLPAAHGALAAIAFGFLFPLGSILMRVVPGRAALFVHGFVQLFSYATYIAGAGLGLYLVSIVHFPPENKSLLDMASTNAHPIIGIALLVALFIQPVLGVAHHRRFKRLKRRTWVSYAHLWTGRLGITLGIINGGLGFALARTQGPAVIAYAVIAGTMWVLWVLIVLLRKFRTGPRAEQREKIAEEGDREAYVPGVRGGGGSSSSRSGSRSPPAPAIVPAAEPDLPPYEPGPDYAAHTAHLRQTASRDSRGSKDDWEGHGSSRRDEDPGPIQSATDDEMGRGQV
ncbi:hypothetical protein F5B22DRAFT_581172 [Xylaria bambusicola]|uniref:uncharacterized protein n=1 Tax=Xylaria bambusicola TaxID=326684 RepID=UPI002007B0A9|nr:uncharacterized protein F5B22DRAFT_581172 [Xylaria bambusicola]KAI0502903.1 hypothetical protein F5B22DRAFT_581172 [Xylaria bambusicola]